MHNAVQCDVSGKKSNPDMFPLQTILVAEKRIYLNAFLTKMVLPRFAMMKKCNPKEGQCQRTLKLLDNSARFLN